MLLLGPCVLYLLAFSVFPLVYSLYVALCDYDQVSGDLTFIGLDNFRELFSSDEFWQATRNTAIFTLGGVALQVVLGHGAGAVLRPAAARRRRSCAGS